MGWDGLISEMNKKHGPEATFTAYPYKRFQRANQAHSVCFNYSLSRPDFVDGKSVELRVQRIDVGYRESCPVHWT